MKNLSCYIMPSDTSGLGNENWLRSNMTTLVKEVVDGTTRRWPGVHKNVQEWYILENGYCVGFNENPGKGWTFPHMKYEDGK